MRSRWVDSLKRSISASPRHDERRPSPSPSSGPSTTAAHAATCAPGLVGAATAAYAHDVERCTGVGVCSVARVLEDCVLQGGVHHTHMHVLTYLGRPLRSTWCCYPVSVQWFRAVGDEDDFQVIPGACHEWYTPTADDIGARVLVKVMIEDKDGLKTKMLEYGPIQEDPQVRSKVELYLERKSVLFMGLQSLSVQKRDNGCLHEDELRESWTLLSDDRVVRLTCESSLLPPFERRYSTEIKLKIACNTPNEFFLYLGEDCFVRLRAESNTVRDIIVLTLRVFCKMAISDENEHDAVACGLPPVILRKIAPDGETTKQSPVGVSTNFDGLLGLKCMLRLYTPSLECDQQTTDNTSRTPLPALARDLPWNQSASSFVSKVRPESSAASADLEALDECQRADIGPSSDAIPISTSSMGEDVGGEECQHIDDTAGCLLSDADALIDTTQKIGGPHQTLPRASKRISISDIPNLEIVEVTESVHEGSTSFWQEKQRARQRQLDQRRCRRSNGSAGDCESGDDYEKGESSIDVDRSGAAGTLGTIDASSIDTLIEDFMADETLVERTDGAAPRDRYVAIFCLLQRELRSYEQRVATLLKQLEEKQELNASLRKDIESLHSALTSMQLADKVYNLVSTDLQQLVTSTAAKTGRTDE